MTTILVAERDAEVCVVVSEILQTDFSATLVCVKTGTLAAQAIATGRFDLAIIDVGMSEICGYDLAARAANRNIPALLCSGHPDADAKLRGTDCPYLAKPFGIDELVSQAALAMAQAGENIHRIQASLAKIRGVVEGLAADMARSDQLISESKALHARAASQTSPMSPDVVGEWLAGLGPVEKDR
jgi:CheY-like chemotaxis protein